MHQSGGCMYKFFVVLLLLLILLVTCNGCSFIVAKKAVDVVDEVLEKDPNPTKKQKILKKQNKIKDKAREFYCSKVKDKEKCNDV